MASIPQPEPSRFGKYQILGRIAAGGTAEIYKAKLEGEGGFYRTFALKRILPHLSSRTDFVDMLVEEAKIAGLLSHANIVQIMDLGEVGGTYYIAMEYVDGPDLGRVLRRCRDKGISLPVPHSAFLVIEVLKGLEYAHQRRVMRGGQEMPLNIVHRDVSPANVLVSFQGEVKLTDFGIAKASVTALQTVSGVIKGRFDYLAPEQAAGNKPDSRADLFATGVLLYEALTGQHPFRQRSEAATVDAIRDGRFPPPSHVNPDVPYALEVILDRALAVDPADRFQTATEFKDSLDRFFHDAGFIFSHSTLAAFLKGLFPKEASNHNTSSRPISDDRQATWNQESVGPALSQEGPLPTEEQETRALVRPQPLDTSPAPAAQAPAAQAPAAQAPAAPPPAAPPPAGPPPAVPAARSDGADRATQVDFSIDAGSSRPTAYDLRVPAPDDPFGIADSTTRKPRPSPLSRAPDLPLIPGGPQIAGLGEEATLIRPPPSTGLDPSEWGDLETVIKPTPPALVQQQRHQAAVDAALPIQDTTIQRPPQPHDTQVRHLRPPPDPGAGFGLHLGYVALIVLCSIISLVLGVVLTQWRLGQDPSQQQLAVPQHEPQLRVELPDDATLSVDGREVPGPSPIEIPLTAGTAHTVDVQVKGYNPVSTRIKLDPNDVRVLSIQLEAPPPNRH